MAESGFDKLQILSQKDLTVVTLRGLLKSYAEFNRREEITKNFLKSLCALGLESWIWFILWEAGGAQRFTDIRRVVGCSKGKLSDTLKKKLHGVGLVKMVGVLYQAVSPAWLVRISEPDGLKWRKMMAESGFDELLLLGQEDLIVEKLRGLLRSYAEPEEITKDFLNSLCALSLETWIWFILWEAGGAQRHTDIRRIVGCSKGKLSDTLNELLRVNLVRKVGVLYQAVSPAWFVRRYEPN